MLPYLEFFVAFSAVECMAMRYLDWRQLKVYSKEKLPTELEALVSSGDFAKSNAYNADKMRFEIVRSLVSTIVSLTMVVSFFNPFVWSWVTSLLGSWGRVEIIQSLAYLLLMSLISTLECIPFDVYFDFVIEERHGFNKKTLGLFLKDFVLKFALTMVIGGPIMSGLILLVRWGGKMFYVWVWIFTVVVGLSMILIYPNYIAPLFNKFESLKDEDLKKRIEDMAGGVGFPLTALYQVDGSKRSAHSNAYFYGLWRNKRIVLYDTLLKLEKGEILAVLGHELGHWKLNHMVKGIALSLGNVFVMLYLYGFLKDNTGLFESFGFVGVGTPVVIGLHLFSCIFEPLNIAIEVLATIVTRHHEFEADKFAVELGRGEELEQALVKLQTQNLGTMDPDPWYAWVHYTHPALSERLRALWSLRAKSEEKKER